MRSPSVSTAPPLSIVPPHPQLLRRRSSHMSVSSSSPCTPCHGSPVSSFFLSAAAKRKSTDSWNSSIGPEDFDTEWKPEQTRLLTRTLDALPAHLVTPFNGPVPPSNLLDKIARGVAQAKGPVDWPHSIRATRAKLLELARSRAKEDAAIGLGLELGDYAPGIAEEVDGGFHGDHMREPEVLKLATNIQRKRPLYRQSSMDFMNAELKDGDRVTARSRLPVYRPYTRGLRSRNRSPSPLGTDAVPSLLNPSTPSSTTLNTLSSVSGIYSPNLRSRAVLRRSISTLSTLSTESSASGKLRPDPRLERMKHKGHALGSPLLMAPSTPPLLPLAQPSTPIMASPVLLSGTLTTPGALPFPSPGTEPPPTPYSRKRSSKRTPSISTLSQSSDEEEKARARLAKKARTRRGHGDVPAAIPVDQATPGVIERVKAPMAKKAARPTPKAKTKPVVPEVRTPCPEPCDVEMKDACMVKPTHVRRGSSDSTRSRGNSACPEAPKKDAGLKADDGEKGPSVDMKHGESKQRSPARAIGSGLPQRARPMTVQRNPSILGAELPHLDSLASSPRMPSSREQTPNRTHPRSHSGSIQPSPVPAVAARPVLTLSQAVPRPLQARPQLQGVQPTRVQVPQGHVTRAPVQRDTKVRTLRRVPRLAPARRISFGNLCTGQRLDEELDTAHDEHQSDKLATPIKLR